jgi:23S rRNA (pseudouridine1915-N3)-methyltransferase
MRLTVAAVGRLKEGPERTLAERYRKRAEQLGQRIGIREVEIVEIRESRAPEVSRRVAEESIAIANVVPERAAMIVLDERGENLDSRTFADRLRRWRDEGCEQAIFVIGGDDGLLPAMRAKANLTLALGAATWPHALARVMLLEQIYRAMSLLAGHPYHRG